MYHISQAGCYHINRLRTAYKILSYQELYISLAHSSMIQNHIAAYGFNKVEMYNVSAEKQT